MRHAQVTSLGQEFDGERVVPEEVLRRLSGGSKRISTTSLFRAAYRLYYGASALERGEGRRRVAHDVLDHRRSGRTWFPYYAIFACYGRRMA